VLQPLPLLLVPSLLCTQRINRRASIGVFINCSRAPIHIDLATRARCLLA